MLTNHLKRLSFGLIAILLILLSGCLSVPGSCVSDLSVPGPGRNDWEYKLPNHYAIWHINGEEIACGVETEQGTLINTISYYVKAFWNNDNTLCLKCVLTREDMKKEGEDLVFEYYVVSFENGNVTRLEGEDEDEVFAMVGSRFEWTPTIPAPEGCVYPE